jgi:shikimate kinase
MPVMQMAGNIFFVGLMGAGKTTVGKLLAKRLGKTFYDSDHEIESRTGVNIPVIFELEGEAGFRKRETMAIEELTAMHDIVLATGGGAVLSKQNRENMSQHGTVIYLRATVNELWHRTKNDKNRPLLQTDDPRAKLEKLYTERDPLYREIADIIIDTGDQSVGSIVQHLEETLNKHANAHR